MEFAHASQFIPSILKIVVFIQFSLRSRTPGGYAVEVPPRSRGRVAVAFRHLWRDRRPRQGFIVSPSSQGCLPQNVRFGSNAERLRWSKCCPLCARKRTSTDATGMSVACSLLVAPPALKMLRWQWSERLTKLRRRSRPYTTRPRPTGVQGNGPKAGVGGSGDVLALERILRA